MEKALRRTPHVHFEARNRGLYSATLVDNEQEFLPRADDNVRYELKEEWVSRLFNPSRVKIGG